MKGWQGKSGHIIRGLRSQDRKLKCYPEWRHLALESGRAGFRFDFILTCDLGQFTYPLWSLSFP